MGATVRQALGRANKGGSTAGGGGKRGHLAGTDWAWPIRYAIRGSLQECGYRMKETEGGGTEVELAPGHRKNG